MKRSYLGCILVAFIISIFAISCDDDAYYGDGYPSDFNKLYANKVFPVIGAGDLKITYSGESIIGKEVYFQKTDKHTAKMKFSNVFPTESTVLIEGIELKSNKDGYSFEGQASTPKGTSFKYSGIVIENELSVEVSQVKIPSNKLSGKTFPMMNYWTDTYHSESYRSGLYTYVDNYNMVYDPTNIVWNYTIDEVTKPLFSINILITIDLKDLVISPLLGKLLYLVLPEISFQEDGNIVAKYAKLNSEIEIMNLISADVDETMRGEQESSPLNFCKYFVNGDKLYVQPDWDMILGEVSLEDFIGNLAGDFDLSEILLTIPDIYSTLRKWGTKGLEMTIKELDETEIITGPTSGLFTRTTNHDSWAGEYMISIEQKEFQLIIDLLPKILPILLADTDISFPIGSTEINLSSFVDAMIANIAYTSEFELGIRLKQ